MRLNKSITIIERITKPFSKYSYLSVIDYQMFGYFFIKNVRLQIVTNYLLSTFYCQFQG
jgi:hypothetical protein